MRTQFGKWMLSLGLVGVAHSGVAQAQIRPALHTAPTAVVAEEVPNSDLDSATLEGAGSSAAQAVDVFALDDNLVVVLNSPAAAAELPHYVVVTRSNGEPISAAPAAFGEGSQEVLIPGALQGEDIGTSLSVLVIGASGEPVDALSVGVGLNCDSPKSCWLDVAPGRGTDAAPSTQDLDPWLDKARLTGMPVSLGALAQADTQLVGDFLTYGKSVADALAPNPFDSPKGDPAPTPPECRCWWQSSSLLRPGLPHYFKNTSGPAFVEGTEGPGAAHWIRARYDGKVWNGTHTAEYYVEGDTELHLNLVCVEILGWENYEIKLGSKVIKLTLPIMGKDCPKCPGKVQTYAEYYADLLAWIDAGWFSSARASAQEEGLYSVNGNPRINRIAHVSKAVKKNFGLSLAIPGLGSITWENGSIKYDGAPSDNLKAEFKYNTSGSDGQVKHSITSFDHFVVMEPATSLFQAKALAFAEGNMDSDAEGKAAMSYMMTQYGFAECANPMRAANWTYYSYEGRTNALRHNITAYFLARGLYINP